MYKSGRPSNRSSSRSNGQSNQERGRSSFRSPGRNDSRRNDSRRDDSRRDDSRRSDNRRDDNRRDDSRRSDNRRDDNRRDDSRRDDNRRSDSRRSDSRRSDSRRDDSRRSDNRRDDNRRSDNRRSDNRRDDNHRDDNRRSDNRRDDSRRDDSRRSDDRRGPGGNYRSDRQRDDRRNDERYAPDRRRDGARASRDDGRGNGRPGRNDQRYRSNPANRGRGGYQSQRRGQRTDNRPEARRPIGPTTEVVGALQIIDGYGFLRNPEKGYRVDPQDPFVSASLIAKLGLKNGHLIQGQAGPGRNGGPVLSEVETVNGATPEEAREWADIRDLVAIAPDQRLHLETTPDLLTMRIVELLTPIGLGSRGLIVAPPRTGKTILLQQIANAVSINHSDVHILALLIDERPEELTDMRRSINGEVVGSSLDQTPVEHRRLSKLMADVASRRVESGQDVFLILDSITRMSRAFNKDNVNSGRTMSGGIDASAMEVPRGIFGLARNIEHGGSLTIIATALIETGSRMDDFIYEEFKGTGNMELVLNRDLANARIWPAIDVPKSGTRKEELLFSTQENLGVARIRRGIADHKSKEAVESLLSAIAKYPTNAAFLKALT